VSSSSPTSSVMPTCSKASSTVSTTSDISAYATGVGTTPADIIAPPTRTNIARMRGAVAVAFVVIGV
jgi:hypothetical protein